MKFGLTDKTIKQIHSVLARYPQVKKSVLYGSRAKGNYKNGSDIDMTLTGGEDLTLNVLYRIMDDIDDLLLPYTFDLSIFRHINDPDVVEHIQRAGVTFYEKTEAAGNLKNKIITEKEKT
jgi:predicted nucleotidyltransferase